MGFCNNCGAELKEGAAFCMQCGAKVADVSQPKVDMNTHTTPQYAPYAGPGTVPNAVPYAAPGMKSNNNKVIAIVAASVGSFILLIILISVIRVLSTPAYEKPLKNLEAAIEKSDFDKLVAAYPDYISDGMDDFLEYYDDEDEYVEEIFGGLEDEFGSRINVTFKVKDKEKMTRDELEDLEEDIDSYYDEEVNIKAGYYLSVEASIKGSEDHDKQNTEMTVIKIGSKWYLSDAMNW
jgi:uncharacterized membrane protein YvbJ